MLIVAGVARHWASRSADAQLTTSTFQQNALLDSPEFLTWQRSYLQP